MRNESVRQTVEADIKQLEEQRRKLTEGIDAKIQDLREGLKRLDSGGLFQPSLPGLEESTRSQEPEPWKLTLVSTGGDVSFAGMGLRAAIKALLTEHPAGLRPFEVAETLVARGYKAGGSLTAKQLVYGEIYRLKKMKVVVKVGRGKYKLSMVGAASA